MPVPITVLMSVYNGERFLKESILSILNQSFKDFEFIIINDGSTDNSINILKEFSILDKRICLINKNALIWYFIRPINKLFNNIH